MRASRLLSIQMLLETRGRMSAQTLADELEVSLRTLYRDVDQLTAAGVPIYAERGRAGGFQLMDGWKTTLTGLTASEAQAVFMIGLSGPAAQLGLGKEVADAQLKLVTALPSYQRSDAQRIQSRFHVDTLEWYKETDPVPHLNTVASAVWDEKQLAIVYESWKGLVRRTIHPLGLVIKSGVWYLVAAIDNVPRTYRISNIQQADVLDARCNRPRKFNLVEYWNDSIQRFEKELYKAQATVLATYKGIKELKLLSAAVAKALMQLPATRHKDGRTKICIPIESMEHAAGQLLRLAPEVEVLEPKELKQALIRKLHAVAKCYKTKL
jgi:predicted DNA-binding transcriptional regulator YafY